MTLFTNRRGRNSLAARLPGTQIRTAEATGTRRGTLVHAPTERIFFEDAEGRRERGRNAVPSSGKPESPLAGIDPASLTYGV